MLGGLVGDAGDNVIGEGVLIKTLIEHSFDGVIGGRFWYEAVEDVLAHAFDDGVMNSKVAEFVEIVFEFNVWEPVRERLVNEKSFRFGDIFWRDSLDDVHAVELKLVGKPSDFFGGKRGFHVYFDFIWLYFNINLSILGEVVIV